MSGNRYGALAQLGARHIRIVEAVGSNPICSIRSESGDVEKRLPDFLYYLETAYMIVHYAANAFAFTLSIALLIPSQTLRSVNTSTTLPMALNGAS